MSSTDDILTSPATALDLPCGSRALHAIVLVEYCEPGVGAEPGRRRLAMVTDDALTPWAAAGMLRVAMGLELDAVAAPNGHATAD